MDGICLIIYKIACLMVGFGCLYLGYKLFVFGIVEKGDLVIEMGTLKIQMKRGAAGAFFALFGAMMIIYTIHKGFNVKHEKIAPDQRTSISSP